MQNTAPVWLVRTLHEERLRGPAATRNARVGGVKDILDALARQLTRRVASPPGSADVRHFAAGGDRQVCQEPEPSAT